MINRRAAMKRIGGMAGAAAMARFLPSCGSDSKDPVGITTYVYMMLENRSYDHVFGSRALLEGKPGNGLVASMRNPDRNGQLIAPWEPTVEQMCDPDPPHGWNELRASWNAGACDGFVVSHQTEHNSTTLIDPMQYLTRTQMPVSYALADAYTSCDNYFCSVMGPTLPNRAYWHTASSFGIGPHPDANSEILNAFGAGSKVPSIYNRLHDKGVDWAYYFGSIAVAALIGGAGPYQLDLGANDGTGNIRRFGDYQGMSGQFFTDAANGVLPPVSYIDPFFYLNDDHPPIHPINGQLLIASVYRALAASPQWKNCMLVVTYDENGGFFDHVSPPTTVDDSFEKFGVDGFQQMGFRVPTLVAGPYVKQNHVSSVVYDHCSPLKHLQTAFGLDSLNVRMDAANDLSDCIDMERLLAGTPAEPIELPAINLDDWPQASAACSHTGGFKYLDPISQWADATGKVPKIFDLRDDPDGYQRGIRDYVRASQLRAKVRG